MGGSLRTDSIAALKTSDTCGLTIPSGDTVTAAYLYWCGSGSTPDDTVSLHGTTVIGSLPMDTVSSYNTSNRYYFSGFADVTSIVKQYKSGSYIFTGLRVDNTTAIYVNTASVVAGWAVVVIYGGSPEIRHTINIYDGLQTFKGDEITLKPNNFYVPFGTVDGKITDITWEGDLANSDPANGYSEDLAFNGQSLSDFYNPIGNQFNSVSNTLVPIKGYLFTYGTDIDTYPVTSLLTPGDTTATTVYSSGADNVVLNAEIISVSDTSNSDIAITDTCSLDSKGDSIIVANQMHYYLTASNNGPDPTGAIWVIDTLQPGAKLVSVSASGWTVDSSRNPILRFTYPGINYPNVTIPTIDITVYVYYDPASYPTLRNSASDSSQQFDRRLYNNTATKSIKVVTPVFLQTTKTFLDYKGYPKYNTPIPDTLHYTIRVKNSGNWDVSVAHANPITVVDSLPKGFQYVTGAPGTAPTATRDSSVGFILTWTNVFTSLIQGVSDSVRYWVIPGSRFTTDTLFINRANVSAPGVNQSVKDTAIPPPIVTITKYFDPGMSKAGDTVQYHLIVKNISPYSASTLTWVCDTLPSYDTTSVALVVPVH